MLTPAPLVEQLQQVSQVQVEVGQQVSPSQSHPRPRCPSSFIPIFMVKWCEKSMWKIILQKIPVKKLRLYCVKSWWRPICFILKWMMFSKIFPSLVHHFPSFFHPQAAKPGLSNGHGLFLWLLRFRSCWGSGLAGIIQDVPMDLSWKITTWMMLHML